MQHKFTPDDSKAVKRTFAREEKLITPGNHNRLTQGTRTLARRDRAAQPSQTQDEGPHTHTRPGAPVHTGSLSTHAARR